MNIIEFTNKIKDFLTFLEVEKNVSLHTLRAYQADLNQLIDFWNKSLSKTKIEIFSFDQELYVNDVNIVQSEIFQIVIWKYEVIQASRDF